MTRIKVRALSAVLLTTVVAFVAAACETQIVDPTLSPEALVSQSAKGGKGGKKKRPPPPEPDPDPEPDYVWYIEVVNYDYDPLYRFGIEGSEVLFRTDPTVTSWGEDYWGYWDEPYTMVDNQVIYTIGLTHTTYTFAPLPSGGFDVSRRLITQPYSSTGTPDTTFTHVGIFEPEG